MLKITSVVILLVLASIGVVLAIEFYELIQATTNLLDATADYLRAKTE